MPLDHDTRLYLEQMAALNFSQTRNLTPAQFRQATENLQPLTQLEPIAKIESLEIPGPLGSIPIRIYSPSEVGPLPILVYFHGGGFVRRDRAGVDALCRRLANLVSCIVVAVDYRLSPEYKFPAAPEACYAAILWAANNSARFKGDPARLGVGAPVRVAILQPG